MASAAPSSLMVSTRAAPAAMASTALGSGTRVATPSTKVCEVSVLTTRPASNDSAVAGASAATTPTTSVRRPSRSRTPMTPQMPEPMPTGT